VDHQLKGKKPVSMRAAWAVAGAMGASMVIGSMAHAATLDARHAKLLSPVRIAQDMGGDDEKEVPPADVEKYIDTYKAMQKDHGLTVEQAASKQGLTLAQFRSLEDKIERDDTLREHVRKALQAPGAKSTPSDAQ
jgi:hypothetical protein